MSSIEKELAGAYNEGYLAGKRDGLDEGWRLALDEVRKILKKATNGRDGHGRGDHAEKRAAGMPGSDASAAENMQ